MKISISEAIQKYGFEFLAIFIGVFAAFALESWNENRKDDFTEIKILSEIHNGLNQDIKDIDVNMQGHRMGQQATSYFGRLILNKKTSNDSLVLNYFVLFRGFISVQNISGYETLKSKGLEIIKNDSLRAEILSLYENDYNSLRKLEESYSELAFFKNYYHDFNQVLAPNFTLDENGKITGINKPLKLSESDKKILITNLWMMNANRKFMLSGYTEVKEKIVKLQKRIDKELKR
ncbi:hypothetical protein SAMN05421780_104190 [Flexibacter flexilis DSM 6793]|uniref:Uncharacterized protein n=1 Tax=Flexibacter flexilis DSM 6793 TaxID=927664 RepID=A0A1I1IBI3_9BACT|nr:hypothetical protein [Flexibacter flexilis]SFC30650.1 hypothetical protein SAMN05421780_104190 [Flexibacter flexilis DSM 6793]